MKDNLSQKEVSKRVKKIGKDVLKDIDSSRNPKVELPIRALSNIVYDKKDNMIKIGPKTQKRHFLNIGQARKFMQTMLVANKIKDLVDGGNSVSIRQLYYMLKHTIPGLKENTFEMQDETDPLIEDVETMTDALREKLMLIATPTGVMSGPLVVQDRVTGDIIDYSKMGAAGGAIPAIVEDERFHIKKCTAKYVLVVEKFAVWNNLNEMRFWKKHNCILLTGKGQAGRAERRLLSRLANEFKLPVYIFTDMDPWGYYIYSVYKYGSINLAFFSEKAAVPTAKYIGFTTKDVKKYNIPKAHWIKLKDIDLKRIKEIKNYDWFKNNKPWLAELKALKDLGYKVEQDSLVAKSIKFTAETYLPEKIKNKDFLP